MITPAVRFKPWFRGQWSQHTAYTVENSGGPDRFFHVNDLREVSRIQIGDRVSFIATTVQGQARAVQVRFEGECLRCPSRDMTLRSGIETTLCNRLQDITGVEEVQN